MAGRVCALAGCPKIVEKRGELDPLFCSEMHLAIYQLGEIAAATGGERYTLEHVSTPIPIRRSGAVW